MIEPKILEANGIRVQRMVQQEREMIIVFPHAYHSGFNHGFNMAEAINFATERWVEYGKRFRDCDCGNQDSEVKILMEPFVREVQPLDYERWKKDQDFALHPEDPWYMEQCLQDAITRVRRKEMDLDEFDRLKVDLRKKREIPQWLKERFVVDYDHKIEIVTNLTNPRTPEEGTNLPIRPRIKAAKRKLIEMLDEGR